MYVKHLAEKKHFTYSAWFHDVYCSRSTMLGKKLNLQKLVKQYHLLNESFEM